MGGGGSPRSERPPPGPRYLHGAVAEARRQLRAARAEAEAVDAVRLPAQRHPARRRRHAPGRASSGRPGNGRSVGAAGPAARGSPPSGTRLLQPAELRLALRRASEPPAAAHLARDAPVASIIRKVLGEDRGQPPRILVVDIHPPHWDHTCHKLCEALENVFCLACSLTGPPRIPSFSLYVVQNQQECLLPFVALKGGFARLQSCFGELGALPREGVFQPKEDAVVQAVLDGLQQFKQYTGQGMAGACLSSSSVEITILTSQPNRKIANQLDAGLQGIDLVSLHQLQVVEISQQAVQELSRAEWGRDVPSSSSGESTTTLNTEVDLHTVENDVVALEDFFKAWLHGHSPDQEHLHLLLPARTTSCSGAPGSDAAWLKCDVQERFLNPAQLPAACEGGTGGMDNAAGPFRMAPGLAPRRLRILRALKADGVCASLLFGLPLVLRPTSCWQLSWDELEANQQSFQAFCHCLWKRKWLLLAKYEAWGGPDLSGRLSVGTFQVLLPSDSSTLLLRPVVARELLLPCSFPPLPADLPEAALAEMEGVLNGLELEATYDPLLANGHLYQALKRGLGRLPASRVQRWAPRQWPRQGGQEPPPRVAPAVMVFLPPQQGGHMHPSRARATVAPLQVGLPPAGSGSLPLSPSQGKAIPESKM
ncbi:meiosis 1 arrest protein [Protobothrops mucrosquamatus]|uniref:meiosis 1 arrest protein n=1 Tax=Protobothrops mucrosquamatus TaxID=103944 RepID=UPI0010FB6F80|nr:meiosis 1 arrest protein [Protobothrops mucrosquamatus]